MAKAWTDKTEYKRLSYQLAFCEGEDAFVRHVHALLRICCPGLIPAPMALRPLGIHLLAPGADDRFTVVVLCQVFAGPEPDSAAIARCIHGLDALRASFVRSDSLLFVHNQDGRSSSLRDGLSTALAALVQAGGIAHAQLLSRELLLRQVFDAMIGRVREAVSQRNTSFAPAPEPFSPLSEVPLLCSTLRADPYRLLSTSDPQEQLADPAALILAPEAPRITFLIGEAGFGKTTATLRAFAQGSHRILYVPGGQIAGSISTKGLLLQCLEGSTLFTEAAPEERSVAELIARPTLEYLLKHRDEGIAVVFDGLDESFFLTRRGGVQILLNLLRQVQVPVVLAARKEYWYARQGDFATFFGIAPAAVAPGERHFRLIELLPWGDEQIGRLARRFAATVDEPAQRARLRRFIDSVDHGGYAEFYGDIPRRPLFLRFILETVAHHDVHRVGRARLFAEWAHLKILRDASSGRAPIAGDQEGGDTTAALAFAAMELAAWHMAQVQDGELALLATCPVEPVLRADPRLASVVDPLGLLLNSLLLPTTPPVPGRPLCVRFAHRAYQEYFLARYLHAHPQQLPRVALPEPVQEWLRDLAHDDPAVAPSVTPPSGQGPLFELPIGTRWEDLAIHYEDGHRVRIRIGGGRSQLRSYHELGMVSQKNRQPTRPWQILIDLCDKGIFRPRRPYDADKTQISVLRKVLQRLFGLADDPFLPFADGAWRPRFHVTPDPQDPEEPR